jgi:hypothetical protein
MATNITRNYVTTFRISGDKVMKNEKQKALDVAFWLIVIAGIIYAISIAVN